MKFENKLKLRITYSIVVSILGVCAFVLGIMKNMQHGSDFGLFAYYAGTGGGLIGVGIVLLKKNLSVLKDKKRMESLMVEEQDERNIQIMYKAGYFTFASSVFILYVVSLYLMFTESKLFLPVMVACSGIVFLYLIFYTVVRKLG